MAKGKKSGGESNVAVLIALVFFILLSIGLGVMYYLGIADIETAKAAAKTADDKEKAATKLKNDADTNLTLYRIFVGTASADEVAGFNSKSPDLLAAARLEHEKFMKAANSRLNDQLNAKGGDLVKSEEIFVWNWPTGGALPAKPSPAALLDRFAYTAADKDNAVRNLTEKATAYEKTKAELQKQIEDNKKTSDDYKGKMDAALASIEKNLAALDTEKKGNGDKFEKAAADLRVDLNKLRREYEEKNAKLQDFERDNVSLRQRLQDLELQLNQINESRRGVFAVNLPHGEILSRKDRIVEINIGSADNLKAGTTFKIQPISVKTDGIASRKIKKYDDSGNLVVSDEEASKGSIEVLEVLGANLSRARITEEPDSIRESILKGDLLFNPLWKKGVADHVVLVGLFDTNADGIDDIGTVIKDLAKLGVVVDAYFDLATRKWASSDPKNRKPGPTQMTSFVIVGWQPEPTVGDPLVAAKSEMITSINTAVSEARQKGAQQIKAARFLGEIGYKFSSSIGDDTVNLAATKYLKNIEAPKPPDEGK